MGRYRVDGKVALITGGAQGIGLGLARALKARGARVALLDRDEGALAIAASSLGALPIVADVTEPGAMERAVERVVSTLGGLDIAVANAGIAPTPATLRTMPAAEWERVIGVNLLGVYRTAHAAIEPVIASQGQLVVVSSVYAFINGMLLSPYAAAKAGVEQLGRALRVELAPHGAGCTTAYFGFVDTQMVAGAMAASPASQTLEDEFLPEWVRRAISPEQAGEAVARAIERRRARIVAPRWWATYSVLRGVVNPLFDLTSAKLPRLQQTLREAEIPADS